MRLDHVSRRLWQATSEASPRVVKLVRRRALRSRLRKKTWGPLRHEIEVVARAAAVVTGILWIRRVVEQLLGWRWISEAVLKGEVHSIIHGVEVDVEARENAIRARRRR